MGMIGNYVAVDDALMNQIVHGGQNILDIDPSQYQTLDIDKSWQAIQYLLCQTIFDGNPPMGYVVPMRQENHLDLECDFDMFYITAQQVKEASEFLNGLDDRALKEKYDFTDMLENEIYPLFDGDQGEEFYEYLYFHLTELKKYFKAAAEKGYAIIFYIM